MIANYGSIFAKSTGDEPGSMGGVKSGTYTAEADWITHSVDPTWRKEDGTVGPPSKGTSQGPWAPGQEVNYKDLLKAMKQDGLVAQGAGIQKYSAANCPGKSGNKGGEKSSKPTKGRKKR